MIQHFYFSNKTSSDLISGIYLKIIDKKIEVSLQFFLPMYHFDKIYLVNNVFIKVKDMVEKRREGSSIYTNTELLAK